MASLVVLVLPVLALLWLAPQVPLFAFAGVLVAVMLRGAAAPIAERTGLPAWGALLLVVTAVGGLLWVGCRAAAPALVAEAETLYDTCRTSCAACATGRPTTIGSPGCWT